MFFPLKTDAHDGKFRMAALSIIVACFIIHLLVFFDNSNSLFLKLALIRSQFNPVNLITSLFTHADWMHLIFNMWFFYLAGVTMEKYWGLGKFLVLYLGIGIVGNITFLIFNAHNNALSNIPLVGASGAIAGMMGAFAFTHGEARVKIFWLSGLRGGTTMISARIYLGFWILGQIVDAVLHSNEIGGVAYSAHISGFISGIIAAKLIPADALYSKAYNTETGAKVWNNLVKEELAQKRNSPRSTLGPLSASSSSAFNSYSPPPSIEPSREGEADALIKQGWFAFYDGNFSKASDLLFRGIDQSLNIDTISPKYLEENFRRLIETIDAKKSLVLPPNAIYLWARKMEQKEWWQWAIYLYDRAAFDFSGATSNHSKQNSLFRAAEIRIKLGVEHQKAREGYQFLIDFDPHGPLSEDARSRLAYMN